MRAMDSIWARVNSRFPSWRRSWERIWGRVLEAIERMPYFMGKEVDMQAE
jgi:hypothetical protein